MVFIKGVVCEVFHTWTASAAVAYSTNANPSVAPVSASVCMMCVLVKLSVLANGPIFVNS